MIIYWIAALGKVKRGMKKSPRISYMYFERWKQNYLSENNSSIRWRGVIRARKNEKYVFLLSDTILEWNAHATGENIKYI